MPSNFDIEVTIGPTEEVEVDINESIPTFHALTGPGLVGATGSVGPRGLQGAPGKTYINRSEILSQSLQNGTRLTFPLTYLSAFPTDIQVFRNGLMEMYMIGYTSTATNLTFTTAPLAGDVIIVVYQVEET